MTNLILKVDPIEGGDLCFQIDKLVNFLILQIMKDSRSTGQTEDLEGEEGTLVEEWKNLNVICLVMIDNGQIQIQKVEHSVLVVDLEEAGEMEMAMNLDHGEMALEVMHLQR